MRRDIGMLGMLPRAALRKGPGELTDFFRGTARCGDQGVPIVYNLLPNDIVRYDTVHEFQRALQKLVLVRAQAGTDEWQHILSPRWAVYRHPLR